MSSRLQQLLLSPLVRSRLGNSEPLLIKTARPDQSGVQPSGDFFHDVNSILRVINDDDSAKPLGLEKAQILVESALTAQVNPATKGRIDAARETIDELSKILERIPPAQQDALNGVYTALATRLKPLRIKLASIPVRQESLKSAKRKKLKPENQSGSTVIINRFDPKIEQIFIRISKLLRERNAVNEHELQGLQTNLDQLINYVAGSLSRKATTTPSKKSAIHHVTYLAPSPKPIYEKLSAITERFKAGQPETEFDNKKLVLLETALVDIKQMRDNPESIGQFKPRQAREKITKLIDSEFKEIERLSEQINKALTNGMLPGLQYRLFSAFAKELDSLTEFARVREPEESQRIFARLGGFVELARVYERCEITPQEQELLRAARHNSWQIFLSKRLPVTSQKIPKQETPSVENSTQKPPQEIARLKAAEARYKAQEAQAKLNQLVRDKIAVFKELNQRIEKATTSKSRNKLIKDFCEQVDKLNHFVKTEQLTDAQQLLTPFIELAEKFKKILPGENPNKAIKEEPKPVQLLSPSLRSLGKLTEKITRVLNKANGKREILISTFCRELGELREHAQLNSQFSKQLDPFVQLPKTWLTCKNLSTKERTLLQAV